MTERQKYLSAEMAGRLAAVDIGTNSIRLIIAEPLADGRYRILDDEREAARLGTNLNATGRLDPEAVQRGVDALRRMYQIVQGYQVRQVRAIATSAVREASDGAEFCQRVRDEIGFDIEIITARQEAELAFYGVVRNFDVHGKQFAVADIGGGSTEIILASGHVIEEIYTTKLGAVRLTERHGGGRNWLGPEFQNLLEDIQATLAEHIRKPPFQPHLLIGSGGTFTSLASMLMARKGQQGLPLRGYQITRAEVRTQLERLRKMNAKARRAVPGLSPERADIIVAGLAIIDRIMQRFKVNLLQIHSGGVRDGLLLTMVDSTLDKPNGEGVDRQAAIDRFAETCGVDLQHAHHVARLAGRIYEQLSEPLGLEPADRVLLEAAAQLQDVGYLINYDGHHKHSYHLILNSRLADFRPLELEIIANLARYHRGSLPKSKHANYQQLASREQKRVRRMGAILRLAGGFDRSHSQQVQDVLVRVEDGRVKLRVIAPEEPEVDLWGARKRTSFFEKTFKLPVDIEWVSPATAETE